MQQQLNVVAAKNSPCDVKNICQYFNVEKIDTTKRRCQISATLKERMSHNLSRKKVLTSYNIQRNFVDNLLYSAGDWQDIRTHGGIILNMQYIVYYLLRLCLRLKDIIKPKYKFHKASDPHQTVNALEWLIISNKDNLIK